MQSSGSDDDANSSELVPLRQYAHDRPATVKPKVPEVISISTVADSSTSKEQDYLDPAHPQYGTVDETGESTPANWREILTVRAFVIAGTLGAMFNVISLKLGLTGMSTSAVSCLDNESQETVLNNCQKVSRAYAGH